MSNRLAAAYAMTEDELQELVRQRYISLGLAVRHFHVSRRCRPPVGTGRTCSDIARVLTRIEVIDTAPGTFHSTGARPYTRPAARSAAHMPFLD